MQGNFFTNQFWAYYDSEGYIVTTDFSGAKQRIGVTLGKYGQLEQKYNQLEKDSEATMSKAQEYLEELYQHGIRQRELTPDEKISALTEQVAKLTAYVGQLTGNNPMTPDCGASQKQVITPEIVTPNRGNNNEFINSGQSGSNFIAS